MPCFKFFEFEGNNDDSDSYDHDYCDTQSVTVDYGHMDSIDDGDSVENVSSDID